MGKKSDRTASSLPIVINDEGNENDNDNDDDTTISVIAEPTLCIIVDEADTVAIAVSAVANGSIGNAAVETLQVVWTLLQFLFLLLLLLLMLKILLLQVLPPPVLQQYTACGIITNAWLCLIGHRLLLLKTAAAIHTTTDNTSFPFILHLLLLFFLDLLFFWVEIKT